MAWLVMTRKFKSVTMNYLTVGHTHEDIGCVWKCKVCIQSCKIGMIKGHSTPAIEGYRIQDFKNPSMQP